MAVFGRRALGRKGLHEDDVYDFLHRVALELDGLETELATTQAENGRLKAALRDWQSQHGDPQVGGRRVAALPVDAVNLLSRAQRQIEVQVAETERYCRLREQEAINATTRSCSRHASTPRKSPSTSCGPTGPPPAPATAPRANEPTRTAAWLSALLRSLDALAGHVDATRKALASDVESIHVPAAERG